MTKTNFRTELPALPTRRAWRQHMSGHSSPCSFAVYTENTRACHERVRAHEIRLELAGEAIRAMLPATEGQLTFGLRANHTSDDVTRALHLMIGNRFGAETTGEIVIVGYLAGGEVYGLRNA